MFCSQCATQVQPGSRFCGKCGFDTGAAAAPQPQQGWGQAAQSPGQPAQAAPQPAWGQPAQAAPQPAWGQPAQAPPQPAWGQPAQASPPAWGPPAQAAPQPAWGPPAAAPQPATPAGAPSTLPWLIIGPILIVILQIATVYLGVKFYVSGPSTAEAQRQIFHVAIGALTVPYFLGGWLIAYFSAGRTVVLAAVAAVISIGLLYVIGPYLHVDLKMNGTAAVGASIIGFICAFIGSLIGENTPGHR